MGTPMASGLRVLVVLLAAALLGSGRAEAKRRKRHDVAPKSAPKPKEEPEKARPKVAEPTPATPPPPDLEVSGRIEFDERLVGGQTAKPGTVRLFERRDSELRSMVRTRRDLRGAVVRSILGTEPAAKEVRR